MMMTRMKCMVDKACNVQRSRNHKANIAND
jgi:hypothetical protein